jgi:hypothetical protein
MHTTAEMDPVKAQDTIGDRESVDSAGNDAYSIQGGNGLGLSNSVAIFVDKSGNDRYERKETQTTVAELTAAPPQPWFVFGPGRFGQLS